MDTSVYCTDNCIGTMQVRASRIAEFVPNYAAITVVRGEIVVRGPSGSGGSASNPEKKEDADEQPRCVEAVAQTFAEDVAARRQAAAAAQVDASDAMEVAEQLTTLANMGINTARDALISANTTPGTVTSMGFDGKIRSRVVDVSEQTRFLRNEAGGTFAAMRNAARFGGYTAGVFVATDAIEGAATGNRRKLFDAGYHGAALGAGLAGLPALTLGMEGVAVVESLLISEPESLLESLAPDGATTTCE